MRRLRNTSDAEVVDKSTAGASASPEKSLVPKKRNRLSLAVENIFKKGASSEIVPAKPEPLGKAGKKSSAQGEQFVANCVTVRYYCSSLARCSCRSSC